MRILIIERDTEESKGIEWYLKNYLSGQIVVESATSSALLQDMIVDFNPSVIIMETELMNAPNQSILLKHNKYVIAVTSSPIFQQAIRAIDVQALQLFIKPIPLEKLKSTLLNLPEKGDISGEQVMPHVESQLYSHLYLNTVPSVDLNDYAFMLIEPEQPSFNLELYNWLLQLPIFDDFKAVPLYSRIICLIKSNNVIQIEKQLRILMQEWQAISEQEMNIAIYTGKELAISEMYTACKKALIQRFYKGYGQIIKSDSPLPLKRFDPLLTPEEQQLWITSLENGDMKQIKQFLSRLTDPENMFHYEDVRIHLTSILAQIRRFMRKYQLHEEAVMEERYRKLFHLILQHPILYAIVQEFILFIQTLMTCVKNNVYQGQVDYVEGAILLVEKEFHDPNLTLHSVANTLNISANYLSNIFSKKCGIPFKKYLQQYRLQQSEKLVVESMLAISEVASQVGFVDSNYFTKVFKDYFKLTPLKYRGLGKKGSVGN